MIINSIDKNNFKFNILAPKNKKESSNYTNSNITYKRPSPELCKVYFTGIPWKINYKDMDVEIGYDPIPASKAIKVFDLLKNGSFLDSYDDAGDPALNKITRFKNLEFLELLTQSNEQQKFIDYYKRLTGFPDIEKVSVNIEKEFARACYVSSDSLENDDFRDYTHFFSKDEINEIKQNKPFDILWVGYNDTCSVGHKKALPGSDLDGAFIVIKGTDNDLLNDKLSQIYRGQIWQNTDQRVLSYNHSYAVPYIYTLKQIKDLTNTIQEKSSILTDKAREHFEQLKQNEYSDYLISGEYNIRLNKLFPACRPDGYLNPQNPGRYDVKDFGYFAEVFKNGKAILKSGDPGVNQVFKTIQDDDVCKYSNLTQMAAHKKSPAPLKPKLQLRDKVLKDFEEWPIEKQYKLIKKLIHYSCNDAYEFAELFNNSNNMEINFLALERALSADSN